MFKFNRHQFFNSLCSDTVESVCPPVDATLQFWSKLWGELCEHDVANLPNVTSLLNTSSIPKMVE